MPSRFWRFSHPLEPISSQSIDYNYSVLPLLASPLCLDKVLTLSRKVTSSLDLQSLIFFKLT
jgi:hypothetical protein